MNRRRVLIFMLGLILSLLLIILALSYGATRPKYPEYVLTYAENQDENYPTTLGAIKFAELVKERTDGRIHILVQCNSVHGSEQEVIKQLQYGGVDFTRVTLSQLAEYIPQMNVLQMPYLYSSAEHMWKVLDGEIGKEFLNITKDYELVGLSWYDAGARNFYNSVHPIEKLEDMKGLRIRVQKSELMADMVEALGAEAYQIDYENVYSNLEQKNVDGAENNWPSYEATSHYKVAGYYTIDEHNRMPEMQICSEHTWNKFSEEDKEIIMECARESALYERELWSAREEESKQIAMANGTKVIELSKEEKMRFQEAMSGIYQKYCSRQMDVIQKIIELDN